MNSTSAPKTSASFSGIAKTSIRCLLIAAIPLLLIVGTWLQWRNRNFAPAVEDARIGAEGKATRLQQLQQLQTDFESGQELESNSKKGIFQFLNRFDLDPDQPVNQSRLIFSTTSQDGCRWALPAGNFRLHLQVYLDDKADYTFGKPAKMLLDNTWDLPGAATYQLDVIRDGKEGQGTLTVESNDDSFQAVSQPLELPKTTGSSHGKSSAVISLAEHPNTWSHTLDVPLDDFFESPHTTIMKCKFTGWSDEKTQTSFVVHARILSDEPVVVACENLDLIQYMHKEFRAVDTGYGCYQLSKD